MWAEGIPRWGENEPGSLAGPEGAHAAYGGRLGDQCEPVAEVEHEDEEEHEDEQKRDPRNGGQTPGSLGG